MSGLTRWEDRTSGLRGGFVGVERAEAGGTVVNCSKKSQNRGVS